MTDACEIPLRNATPDEIRALLASAKTIAVVGLSPDPARPSHRVAAYLKDHGYRVVPVNPGAGTILGEQAVARVQDVPSRVDIAVVFRKPEAVPGVVEDAIAAKAGAVWMQEGIAHNAAAGRSRAAGLAIVMDRCIQKEHRAVFEGRRP